MISSIGDPLRNHVVSERRLRPLLTLNSEQQVAQVEMLLSRCWHNESGKFESP